MRATGFNHVSIHAVDLEQSVRFYTEVLRDGAHPDLHVRVPGAVPAPRRPAAAPLPARGRGSGVPSHRHRRGRFRRRLRARAGARHRREGLVLRGHVRAAGRLGADVPARPRGQPHRARLARRDDDRSHARARHPQALDGVPQTAEAPARRSICRGPLRGRARPRPAGSPSGRAARRRCRSRPARRPPRSRSRRRG